MYRLPVLLMAVTFSAQAYTLTLEASCAEGNLVYSCLLPLEGRPSAPSGLPLPPGTFLSAGNDFIYSVVPDAVDVRISSYSQVLEPYAEYYTRARAAFAADYSLTITTWHSPAGGESLLFSPLYRARGNPSRHTLFCAASWANHAPDFVFFGEDGYFAFESGRPQSFSLKLTTSSIAACDVEVGLTGFAFYVADSQGVRTPLTGTHFTLAEVPEPAAWLLVAGGVALLATALLRSRLGITG
jgi:hypothetical protein